MPNSLACEHCLTPDGWERDCLVEWDEAGVITRIAPGEGGGGAGILIPGMPNAHSHAFQRAMLGHGERRAGRDSFWSWREAMYRLAARASADDLYTIARQAYAEMLAGGYTAVAEFHYLHHAPDGARGPEMSEAVVRAAADAGIALTLLPVCYVAGGFGRRVEDAQARFAFADVDAFLTHVDALRSTGARMGVAAHSLRAVPARQLEPLMQGARELLGADCPLHIHVAEQQREVDDCLEHHGKRPLELLVDSVELDAHWNLVHATHALDHELEMVAGTDARVVLCPLTEAYLGDGIFPAVRFAELGGEIAIGSDSDQRMDAVEELRLLEYGQRLRDHQRARLADAEGLGVALWRRCAEAGAAALLRSCRGGGGGIEEGAYADLLLLDTGRAPLAGLEPDRAMDALITAGDRSCIAGTWVAGQRADTEGPADYAAVAARLMEDGGS